MTADDNGVAALMTLSPIFSGISGIALMTDKKNAKHERADDETSRAL